MGLDINAKAVGLKELTAKIRQKEERLTDMSPFWESVGMYMVKRTLRDFDREQSPDGVPWKPLSASRLKQRKKRRGRMKILNDTGALRRSIGFRSFKTKVVLGKNLVAYAAVHQYGHGNIPARPFLGITDDDREKVLKMMKSYFKRKAAE